VTATAIGASDMHTAIYVGTVRHRRFDRVRHDFAVRLWFVYLDLEELDAAFAGRWLWSASRIAPMRFRRADYFGDRERALADCVRDAVQAELGIRPDGPVRVLTNLRCLGYAFNPVTFYYCFDRAQNLVAMLAEITNTPWGERHHYVIGGGEAEPGASLRRRFAKRFHVSPFQPMAQQYRWTVAAPGDQLAVHMQNMVGDDVVFEATLAMERRAWTTGNLLRALARHPWMTAKVIAMIYLHAFLLWCKRATFHVHPKTR
jgi:uncharacterized protein